MARFAADYCHPVEGVQTLKAGKLGAALRRMEELRAEGAAVATLKFDGEPVDFSEISSPRYQDAEVGAGGY